MRPLICDVYLKEDGVFVLSWTVDEKHSHIRALREPVFKLDREPTPLALGRAVRQALDTSGMTAPGSFGSFDAMSRGGDEILRKADVKGWTSLASSARVFSIEDDGARVTIRARRYRPSDPKLDDAICGRDLEEIGPLLLRLRPDCPVSDPLSPVRPGRSYRPSRPGLAASDGGTPPAFGYKSNWIVVDTTDASAVASALGLRDVRPATWDIDPYGHGGVFVSPSVLGWTFVLGLSLEPQFPNFLPLLEILSRLGEVQYFATHRVVDQHAWARAIGGSVVRAYGWLGDRGELLIDLGDLTPEEAELGFARFINSRTIGDDWDEEAFPDEDDVMQIAGKWSINPQELDAYRSLGPGFLGTAS